MGEAGEAEEEELLRSIAKWLPEGPSPRQGLMTCKILNNSRWGTLHEDGHAIQNVTRVLGRGPGLK